MYSKEKDYCVIGGIVTLFVLIFGPVAVIMVWLFVGMFCLSYRQQLYKNVSRYGVKVFGSYPEGNPDYWVYYNAALKQMKKDIANGKLRNESQDKSESK